MASDFDVGVAVIDIDENVVRWKNRAHAANKVDDVRPGNESNIGQSVVARSETEAADKNAVKVLRGNARRENVVHTDERNDVRVLQFFQNGVSFNAKHHSLIEVDRLIAK